MYKNEQNNLFLLWHIAYLTPVVYVETGADMLPCVTILVDAVSFILSWINVGGHLKQFCWLIIVPDTVNKYMNLDAFSYS